MVVELVAGIIEESRLQLLPETVVQKVKCHLEESTNHIVL